MNTYVTPPEKFGENDSSDAVFVLSMLDYKSGKLYRKVRTSRNTSVGDEAGTIRENGYVGFSLCGKIWWAHRIIWLMHNGCWPEEIDHINGNRSDNRIENLRNVNRRTNAKNLKRPADNKSGFVGVFWVSRINKWHSRIGVNRKSIHLGYFIDLADAVTARKNAEHFYGFHPNHGRPQ